MKLTTLASLLASAVAFNVNVPKVELFRPVRLSASVDNTAVDDATETAKKSLLDVAERIKDEFGTIVIDKTAQEDLKKAVEDLEMIAIDEPQDPEMLLGDWTLVCSTASASTEQVPVGGGGFDTSKLPFLNAGPVKDIRKLINRSLKVEQRVLSTEDDPSTTFDRIDHVLEYQPPSKLTEFLDNVPEALRALNLNPLNVSTGKFVLIHKAELESAIPVIKTKLSLSSVVGTCFIVLTNFQRAFNRMIHLTHLPLSS